MQHLAVGIRDHLDFDVARLLQIFFHIDGIIAERRFGFGARGGKGERQFGRRARHLHAAPAAAGRRLDQHRIAHLFGELRGFGFGRDGAVRAGHGGNAERFHRLLGRDLVAHQPDVLGLRPDEGDAVRLHDVGEMRVLGQKAVAGMDRIGAGDLAGGNDRGNVQIGLAGGRRADADRFIGEPHMHRIRIGGGMDRDGCDAHFLAGAVDPERNLAAVRNQDLFEHGHPNWT